VAVPIVPPEPPADPLAARRISPLRQEDDNEPPTALATPTSAMTDASDEPPMPEEIARNLPTAPSAPTRPLGASPTARLHVRFASFGQDRLVPVFEEVARALRGRPGETAVVLHIPVGPGQEETMEARYRVAYDPELLAEIARKVDPALVRLELTEG
jgi:hypothetical protein